MPQATKIAAGIVALVTMAGTAMAAPHIAAGKPKVNGGINAGQGPADNFDTDGPARPDVPSRYLIATPGAKLSEAVLVLKTNAQGVPTNYISGYQVSSDLLVKAENLAQAANALALANAMVAGNQHGTIDPAATQNMPGWWVVETPNVGSAIALANALRSTDLLDRVEVDAQPPKKPLSLPTDPLVASTWHLQDSNASRFSLDLADIYAMGYTGQGVGVGVLDFNNQPPQFDHPDLAANFGAGLSMAFDIDPDRPDLSIPPLDHATAVSGIIAAVGNNGIGSAGVAYEARLGALRNGTSRVLGDAFSFRNDALHVKNNSWGPIQILGPLPFLPPTSINKSYMSQFVSDTLKNATENGRGGAGNIFVFAAGNEALDGTLVPEFLAGEYIDNDLLDPEFPPITLPGARVEYNQFAEQANVIMVGAATQDGTPAAYTTPGTSVLIGAPSAPAGTDPANPGITTTDLIGGDGYNDGTDSDNILGLPDYTNDFGGTSAAAPMVSGVIALMLDANPSLTDREIKHILKTTARIPDGAFDPVGTYGYPQLNGTQHWQNNGAFTKHSDEIGFGIIDAEAAIQMAADFDGLPDQIILDTGFRSSENGNFDDGTIPDATLEEIGDNFFVLQPGGTFIDQFCVRPEARIEWIEVTLNVDGRWPGDLFIVLTSPYGSQSIIAYPRPDFGRFAEIGTYTDSIFVTYKHWDELSGGTWQISFTDFIPDEEPPEIPEPDPDTGMLEDPPIIAAAPFYYLGGFEDAEEKTLVSYRVRMYATETGMEPFRGCNALANSTCPADFDGDGDIDRDDFLDFLALWEARDPSADLNGDGFFTFEDIQAYYAIFQPGFCNPENKPGYFPWGRPVPGVGDQPDIIPIG